MLIVSQRSGPFFRNDKLISINGNNVADIIDVRYFLEEQNEVLIIRGGQELALETSFNQIKRLSFYEEIPNIKTCQNKCLFCFVDQLPKGLRKTLYFKDDDWRLSFLSGNFVTLTNIGKREIDRIIKQRISPLYVSLHTTDSRNRARLLSANDDKALANLRKLDEKGILTHIQIVLCPGLNDKKILTKTIEELVLFRNVESVGIVPVGITKFHKNKLSSLTKSEAKTLITFVSDFQKKFSSGRKSRWIFLSDEIYILAGADIQDASYYENYPQLENGIGLARKWLDGIENEKILINNKKNLKRKIVLVTGELFGPILKNTLAANGLDTLIEVRPIKNDFFGPNITVAGLITAKDIFEQIKPTKDLVLIPDIMVNENNLFLDNVSFADLQEKLPTAVLVTSSSKEFCYWLNDNIS